MLGYVPAPNESPTFVETWLEMEKLPKGSFQPPISLPSKLTMAALSSARKGPVDRSFEFQYSKPRDPPPKHQRQTSNQPSRITPLSTSEGTS